VRIAPSPPTPIRDTAAQDRPIATAPGRRRVAVALAIAALAALAVLAVARWASSERSVDGARLRIAEVTRGSFVRDAAVTGRMVAAVSPTLYAPRAGTVTLAIRAGDAVVEGQVVAELASPELDAELQRERSSLAQLEAGLGSARIATGQQRLSARRDADETEIAVAAARRELESALAAWKSGVISEIEYRRADDAVRSATVRHEHASAAAGLAGKSAGFDLTTAKRQVERQRLVVADLERRVAELSVRSPVAGVVGTLAVADRALVAANTPLMTVVDLARLEVELAVPETYADDLGLGMKVEIDLGGGRATGTLAALSPEVVDGHVQARARFDGEQPPGLRQSQRVSARILIEQRADVVVVARGPWAERASTTYVVDGDVAVRRPVRIGATSVAAVEILEGLAPGDRVVIAGSETFEDAARVRLND
jgi:HlyD family secretion protein